MVHELIPFQLRREAIEGYTVGDPHLNTRALRALMTGEGDSCDALAEALRVELQQLARAHLGPNAHNRTLSPTALVNEAWLKLIDHDSLAIDGRAQFFALASKVIRSVLVDYERARAAHKRGGDRNRLQISQHDVADSRETRAGFLDLEEALQRLFVVDEELGRIVELRYFGGLSNEDIAKVMGVSPRTVMRHWRTARAWLHDELSR